MGIWTTGIQQNAYIKSNKTQQNHVRILRVILHHRGIIPKAQIIAAYNFCARNWQLFFQIVLKIAENNTYCPECWSRNLTGSEFAHHSAYIWQNAVIPTMFLAATKQLYKWYFPSVRLSVCPSVRLSVTPFWLCSHHRIIMKFSGVITNDQSKVHAKGQGQRSKVKVTEVTTQLNRFRTVTPVWIHIWWWNDAYSLMLLRRGALLFFKVIRQISRSHGSKNRRIWPRWGVSGL